MLVITDMCSNTENSDYTSEVMCAGWNPEIAKLQGRAAELVTQLIQYQSQATAGMPTDMVALDVDCFLERMYASQR